MAGWPDIASPAEDNKMPLSRKPKKALTHFLIAGVIAAVCGIGAIGLTMFALNSYSSSVQLQEKKIADEAVKAKQELAKVKDDLLSKNASLSNGELHEVVALTDIPVGSKITKDMVGNVQISGYKILPKDHFPDESLVIGKITSAKIIAGESLTAGKLIDSDKMLDVGEGSRAITIPVDNISGVNGAIFPGARIDLLLTLRDQQLTKTLLQDAVVIAVGAEGMNKTIRSVTLAVTPAEAEMLALANSMGVFHITLRNNTDNGKAKIAGADIGALLRGLARNTPNAESNLTGKNLGGQNVPDAAEKASALKAGKINSGPPSSAMQPEGTAGAGHPTFTVRILKGNTSEDKTYEME